MTTTMMMPIGNDYSSNTGLAAQQHSQLASLKHYPQAIFLLHRDMTLLETNDLGEKAIESQWIGLVQGKLHFNNKFSRLNFKISISRFNISSNLFFRGSTLKNANFHSIPSTPSKPSSTSASEICPNAQ